MSKVHRFVGLGDAWDWENTPDLTYMADSKGVTGKMLVGAADGAPNFRIRYFRIEAGGYSSRHSHNFDHGVYIVHGQARVKLGQEEVEVGPRDVVYISANEEHQLRAVGNEPLGFLCVIPAID